MASYEDFLRTKALDVPSVGIDPCGEINPALFPFQRDSVRWALKRGRAALFFDCGLGKTPMQLVWADHVARHTGRPVLILAPLAVSSQTVAEGVKFGVRVTYAADHSAIAPGVNITNYERLDKFDASAFAGVVLDESSILKSYSGPTKNALVNAFTSTPYRLACTATPAPNDHVEIGNHAEFLGVMPSSKMLARWFINDTSLFGNYRLKGHAIGPFWDWVTSWARCAGKPSDLGDSDDGFTLPPLTVCEHIISDIDVVTSRGENLFRIPDMSATAFHREKRITAPERAAKVAALVRAEPKEQWLLWSDTDYEADALCDAIPKAVDVRGSDSQEKKTTALTDFAAGKIRVLVTKPKLAGFGMNWQQCARVAFVGPSFSYEMYYQAIRRVWRFGQKRPVVAHVCMASTEAGVWRIVRAKAEGHDELKREMFAAARRSMEKSAPDADYRPTVKMQIPSWLRPEGA